MMDVANMAIEQEVDAVSRRDFDTAAAKLVGMSRNCRASIKEDNLTLDPCSAADESEPCLIRR